MCGQPQTLLLGSEPNTEDNQSKFLEKAMKLQKEIHL